MRRQLGLTLSLAAALAVGAPTVGFVPPTLAATSVSAAFVPFASCTRFLSYVRDQALPLVGPYGLAGQQGFGGPIESVGRAPATTAAPATIAASVPNGAPATVQKSSRSTPPAANPVPVADTAANASATSASGGSSATNTQEAGVDEGDLVENDGRRVYSVVDGRLRIVDTRAEGGPRQISSAALPNGTHQLLLDGDRLAVVTAFRDIGAETVVSLYNVSDPANPRLSGRTHLEGEMVAARTVGHRARIVVRTSFGTRLPFVQPQNPSDLDSLVAARNANRTVVRNAKVADWMPRIYGESDGGQANAVRSALRCAQVGRPAESSGLAVTWVATLDLNVTNPRSDAFGAAGVVGTGNIVYASEQNLFIATSAGAAAPVPAPLPAVRVPTAPIIPATTFPAGVVPRRSRPITRFHAFDLSVADGARYAASGSVDGVPLNQFSMSEHAGVVRIATTGTDPTFGTTTESAIHILQRNGRSYTEIGTLGGLGRTERIYAVRFIGDLGYVVTFRRTDPLYVVDLRDPRRPALAGELKIPGYSAYLHPVGSGLMIGIGQDATDQGRITGTQLSLFDVNDPYAPARLANLKVGGTSDAEYDHHAFLYWPQTGTTVIPNSQYSFTIDPATGQRAVPFSGAVVARVTLDSITEQGRITHNPTFNTTAGSPFPAICPANAPCPIGPTTFVPIQRSLIVDDRLVTVSARGLKITALSDLAEQGWAPFS